MAESCSPGTSGASISRFDSECQSSPSPCSSPSNSEESLYTSCSSEDDLCLATPTSIHNSQVGHVLHPLMLQCSYTMHFCF